MIAFIIFVVVFGLSGWVFAMWVNNDWYRDSLKTINKWYDHCMEINESWYNRANELAKQLDEIRAEDVGTQPVVNDYAGLKVKYVVRKVSNGELVDDCFVLRPDKDKAAIAALEAYADATENQVLAADIHRWLSDISTKEES